jgi:hypothetical protein
VADRLSAVTEPVYGSVDRYADMIREATADEDQVFNVAFGMIDALTDYPTPRNDRLTRIQNVVGAAKRVRWELVRARLEVTAHD